MRCFHLIPVVVFCSLSPFAFAQQTYTFVSLDYPGATTTQCSGINSEGEIVGSYTTSLNAPQPFYRNASGQFSPLLGGKSAVASGVNDSGVIVGSTVDHQTYKIGYVLYKDGLIPVSASNYDTRLTGISTNNRIVGTFSGFGGSRYGFEIVDGKTQQLPLLDGESVLPLGINSEGSIVALGPGDAGFLLNAGGSYQLIQYPGDVAASSVDGINDLGVVVGYRIAPGETTGQGFTYFQGTFTDVAYPGSLSTSPFAISNLGVIVGVYQDAGAAFHCFIATPVQ